MRIPTIELITRLSAFALIVSTSLATVRGDDGIRYPGYLPSFPAPAPATGIGVGPGPGTWLGGDAGFCCPLDGVKSFWTFTDVPIGPVGAKTRLDSTNYKKGLAIGNTVAIASCKNGQFTVDHYFRGSAGSPRPFFQDPNNLPNAAGGTRLWPRKATLIGGKLYIFAHQGASPGNVYNTLLIRVSNPHSPPGQWIFDYLALGRFAAPVPGKTEFPAPIYFGKEVLLDLTGTYLYTYGIYYPGSGSFATNFHVTALRIPLAKIESLPAGSDLGLYAEYMTSKPGVWKAGLLDPTDYYDVGIPAFNGFTVRYNSTLKTWQTVFQDDRAKQLYLAGQDTVTDPLVNSFFVMTGPTPYGPWSTPVKVAEFPEMNPNNAKNTVHTYSPDNYAYFVGEREAFEPSDHQIVVTYSLWSYQSAHYDNNAPILINMKQDTVDSFEVANPLLPPK